MKNKTRKKIALRSLWVLFLSFFKAGTFTFAGGLAMLPLIERDIVEKNDFMTRETFLEYVALAQSLPGVIALNCASFVGNHVAGVVGMLVAGFGATFSAFVLMLLATAVLQVVPQSGPVAGAFLCIRAASAGLVLSAAVTLGQHSVKGIFSVIVMIAAFALIIFLQVSAPLALLLAGVSGIIYQMVKKHLAGKRKGDGLQE